LWEQQQRTDAGSLYQAAVCRAVTAKLIRATDPTPESAKQADAEADRAMAWLTKAVAAGYTNANQLHTDDDLAAIRDRAEFAALVKSLTTRAER
jgi:hypothetical protein